MIEQYWYEFSKIYARLMRLEYNIKHSAVAAIVQYYGDDTLNVMLRYFQQKRRRDRYMRNDKCVFDAIINNNQKDNIGKFVALINELYLSDLLVLIFRTEQFDRKEIYELFFNKVPEDIRDLSKNYSDLVTLRNCIAHYNFELYQKNKIKFLKTLFTFEMYIGHNLVGLTELPVMRNKLSIAEILRKIREIKPDLITDIQDFELQQRYSFDKQRVLLSLFDDIALYNGYDASNLPQPWTILRQVFKLKSETTVC